jgi:hypothetical protein
MVVSESGVFAFSESRGDSSVEGFCDNDVEDVMNCSLKDNMKASNNTFYCIIVRSEFK